jgi:hypothetical protein
MEKDYRDSKEKRVKEGVLQLVPVFVTAHRPLKWLYSERSGSNKRRDT